MLRRSQLESAAASALERLRWSRLTSPARSRHAPSTRSERTLGRSISEPWLLTSTALRLGCSSSSMKMRWSKSWARYCLTQRTRSGRPFDDLSACHVQTFQQRLVEIADHAHNSKGMLSEGIEFLRGLDETERRGWLPHSVASGLFRRLNLDWGQCFARRMRAPRPCDCGSTTSRNDRSCGSRF